MRRLIVWCLAVSGLTAACSSVDCPLNHTVSTNYVLQGRVDTLSDTLTITTLRADNTDTVLINRNVATTGFDLPVSYVRNEDVLVLTLVGKNNAVTRDTVWVNKTSRPHFESVDCGMSYFHTLKGVRSTRHALDSVVLKNTEVTYDATKEHFHIYFKSGH